MANGVIKISYFAVSKYLGQILYPPNPIALRCKRWQVKHLSTDEWLPKTLHALDGGQIMECGLWSILIRNYEAKSSIPTQNIESCSSHKQLGYYFKIYSLAKGRPESVRMGRSPMNCLWRWHNHKLVAKEHRIFMQTLCELYVRLDEQLLS